MKANNSKNTMFAKRVATMLVAIMMGVSAWGNETLTLLPGYNWGSGSGYKTGTGNLDTDAGHAIGLSWTSVMNSTGIQLAAKAGVLESTSCLSANHKIKSITINVSINTIKLYCSTDGSTWSDEISFTSGEAKNVSSSNYTLFRVTSTNDYAKASSIVVEYVSTVPYTVTFDAQSGNCGTASLDESEGGAGVQLPEATLSDALTTAGWSFFGWATTACAESTTTAPTIVGTTGDRYYPSSNETLYAVYKKNESTYTNDYHKISSVGALESGVDYVIADKYYSYNNALKAEEYSNQYPYYMAETAVTVTDDVISSPASSIVWNITKNNDGKVYLKNGSNYLYITYYNSHYNLKLASTIDNTNEEWFTPTFAAEDGALTLASQSYSSYSLQYNYSYGEYKTATSAGDGKIYVYKRQRNATYYSNPCDKFMSLTTVNTSTATLAIGASSIATCGGGAASRQVTITATPATGYTFISTSRLNYTGDGTAEYVSGPTVNGDDFDFVYQFSQSDNGDGEFSATASPKTYTITLNRNGGAGEAQQVTATYNSATMSAAITVPEKEDYIFDGWYSEEGGNGELVISKTGALQANVTGYTGANGIWTKDAATTLYAKWTMHSFVNYRTRCCDLDVVMNLAVSATTENSVTLTWSLPAVMDDIENFRIVKASDGTTVVDNIDETATSAVVSDLTECTTYSFRVASVGDGCKNNSAIIEATPFEGAKTVTFDYNGGSGSMSEFVTACGAKTVTLPTPNDRDGYTFDGWYNGSDKIGDAGEDYTPTENITLKAQYTAIPRHSITLKAMGSNYKTIANKLEGSSVWTLIKDEKGPKMTGYAFIGWSVSENSTTVLTEGTAGTLGADKTLHAVYQKAEYKYVKVTTTSDITDGQYLIVYGSGNLAFDGSLSTLDAVGNTIDVVITSNEIAVNDDTEAAEFTIDATNKTIKSASGFYIDRTTGTTGGGMNTTASNPASHELSIDASGNLVDKSSNSTASYLYFNDASNQMRFRYFTNAQKYVQLYKKTTILAPSTEVVVPTLTVANNQTVNADELYPDGVAGNIVVEVGGKLNVSDNLNVNNIFIESEACASGQVIGATNLHGDLYMDVTFFKGATTLNEEKAGRWYMISAPFDVNLSDGFTLTDGTPMHFGVDDNALTFDLFEYDGKKRGETGVTGWKRVQGKMKAGTACLIGFNPGQPTTIRLKAASAVGEPESIELKAFTGDSYNQNWNGVANPTLHYTNISHDVQTYNNEDGENGRKYIGYSHSSTSFVVGTAFFVQETGTMTLSPVTTPGTLRAPKRESERYEACVQIFRQEATEFADQMYVRASETASNEYEQGHDMITWNGTTGNTAMIWADNYGKRLAIEEAPLVSNQASYALGIFAPKAGQYRIAATSEDDADLYLTYEGSIIWNLSMGAYEIELAKGATNGYGLLLQAKAPSVATGVDEVTGDGLQVTGAQKVIIDEHVFILRGGQMYDVTGKMVK